MSFRPKPAAPREFPGKRSRRRGVGLVMAIWLGGLASASGVIATVGDYQTETAGGVVSLTAGGSAFDAAAFHASMQTAFPENRGGVINFDSGSLDAGSLRATYGSDQDKAVVLTNLMPSPSAWQMDDSHAGRTPVSGNGVLSDPNSLNYWIEFTSLESPAPMERVVQAGVTVLGRSTGISNTPVNLGLVTVTAYFSDGTSTVASRQINEGRAVGNTFYGFSAPSGLWITSLAVNVPAPNGAGTSLDDLGFITAVVPEPGVIPLLLIGAAGLWMARRRRAAQARIL